MPSTAGQLDLHPGHDRAGKFLAGGDRARLRAGFDAVDHAHVRQTQGRSQERRQHAVQFIVGLDADEHQLGPQGLDGFGERGGRGMS